MSGAAKTPLWTHEAAARATGGHTSGAWQAVGVSIDSRTLEPGDLFVAISGPNFDGHDFVAKALAQGAAAALVDHVPDGVGGDAPLLIVDDTERALDALGRHARERTQARVIAITGSVGKTGTKEALRLALEGQGPTTASRGSFNNHWGVPLSLARMVPDAAFGVFEIGMNHPGEIMPLTRLARPHVAVITAVEGVHSAHFDSIEAIADAKAEIFVGLEPGGTAVLNRDNDQFDRLRRAAVAAGATAVIGFGAAPEADARLIGAGADADGTDVVADILGRRVEYRIGAPGRHWVMNSLAVLAAAEAAGADVNRAAGALVDMRAPKGRGQRHQVALGDATFTVIDESYNASPASMAAAIEVLGGIAPDGGGRRIAALGDMLELGAEAERLHAGLVENLMAEKVNLVFTAGPLMAALWAVLPRTMQGDSADESAALVPKVTAAVRAGDVVMVKGSAGSRTGVIVEALLAMGRLGAAARETANG